MFLFWDLGGVSVGTSLVCVLCFCLLAGGVCFTGVGIWWWWLVFLVVLFVGWLFGTCGFI